MGYLHIENLYRPEAQGILMFKEVYALEKVHGTSAHISWRMDEKKLHFFSGGEKQANFEALFDKDALRAKAESKIEAPLWTIYGEAYGGKCQGMSQTYGPELRFIAFDVKIDDKWLSVPDAEKFAEEFGVEFVPYKRVSTDLEVLNAERDAPSRVAKRRGIVEDKASEGIVLRPIFEVTRNNGSRVMAKHKGEAFSERATPQKVVDPEKLKVLQAATAIADEWVTSMRLEHVLQKMPQDIGIESTGKVIAAMIEDVYREAKGEIVESKEAQAAIGKRTAVLFKACLNSKLE